MSATSASISRKFLGFLAVAAVTLILCEVAFRAYDAAVGTWVFDKPHYDRFRGRAGMIRFGYPINSLGFIDSEPSPEESAFRIVALGDSFVFGVVPYPENFLTLVDESLSDVEIINMGIPRIGPGDYRLLLEREALLLEPDLVLVHFYLGNDFHERKAYEDKTVSYVWEFLRAVSVVASEPGAAKAAWKQYDDDLGGLSAFHYQQVLNQKLGLFEREGTSVNQAMPHVMEQLSAMRDAAANAGAGFAVIILPDELTVDQPLQESTVAASNRSPLTLDFRVPGRLLKDQLRAADMAFLDLTGTFVERGATTRLYKPSDTHWNLAGNALASEVLESYLRANGVDSAKPGESIEMRTVPWRALDYEN